MDERKYLTQDDEVKSYLLGLIDPHTSVEHYRRDFFCLGEKLGELLASRLPSSHVMLSCAAEDADFLAAGLLRKIKVDGVAVFWHKRLHLPSFDVAPIQQRYVEEVKPCKALIVAKSIISSACVVKTQLNALIDQVNPDIIYIVAPVRYQLAEQNLQEEFPKNIYKKFQFFSFAVDAHTKEGTNIVLPGIGGEVTERLDWAGYQAQHGCIPQLIQQRSKKQEKHAEEKDRSDITSTVKQIYPYSPLCVACCLLPAISAGVSHKKIHSDE